MNKHDAEVFRPDCKTVALSGVQFELLVHHKGMDTFVECWAKDLKHGEKVLVGFSEISPKNEVVVE
jgi:hypothetical protein